MGLVVRGVKGAPLCLGDSTAISLLKPVSFSLQVL